MLATKVFYFVKPCIPRFVQLSLRRQIIRFKVNRYKNVWPIDSKAARTPAGWRGWPDGKRFALILTHDVDTDQGQSRCYPLMELDKQFGFCSSFYFVPERYEVNPNLLDDLKQNGFEVGVHGLNHDGRLYRSHKTFNQRAKRINQYLKDWNAVGFRSPSMHHNLDWIQELAIRYDASTFDTDPFEAQPDGVRTIFPFWVHGQNSENGYVELPYTLPQDFTLFILMGLRNIDIWKSKLDWIAANGGMALINTHPDYICFNQKKAKYDEYPVDFYAHFLEWISSKFEGKFWHALPKDLARFWTQTYPLPHEE